MTTTEQTYVVTPTQRRILTELARDGAQNPEIAQRLQTSTSTLKWHLAEVMANTGCRTRTALVLWWIRQGQYAGEHDHAST